MIGYECLVVEGQELVDVVWVWAIIPSQRGRLLRRYHSAFVISSNNSVVSSRQICDLSCLRSISGAGSLPVFFCVMGNFERGKLSDASFR